MGDVRSPSPSLATLFSGVQRPSRARAPGRTPPASPPRARQSATRQPGGGHARPKAAHRGQSLLVTTTVSLLSKLFQSGSGARHLCPPHLARRASVSPPGSPPPRIPADQGDASSRQTASTPSSSGQAVSPRPPPACKRGPGASGAQLRLKVRVSSRWRPKYTLPSWAAAQGMDSVVHFAAQSPALLTTMTPPSPLTLDFM